MPKRTDIRKILLIGSGPIVIGQACEFDYSGTQACKALREEGYTVVLVNSNPATIMTDPETADRTYVEPITWQVVAQIIEKERPDALLPTLGGTGGGIAYNREEFNELIARGLELSPTHEVLVEESAIGWKEFELEVMRDNADNVVIVCSIENLDPMGVHTGDSITVAPAQTLTDKEYQRMRDAALAIIREIGVETGGSNIQFAIDPDDGRMIAIEMNPRVSRSSALASKATGFPIAKVAAKLAVGYRLDELKNDITRETPACFEPTIDYVVTKVPRFNFEKFPDADPTLTTQLKSVGETMAIGRTFKESLQKALRGLETGSFGLGCDRSDLWGTANQNGYSDRQLSTLWHTSEMEVRRVRKERGIEAVFKLVDTCAAEFEAYTPYYYSTYERPASIARIEDGGSRMEDGEASRSILH